MQKYISIFTILILIFISGILMAQEEARSKFFQALYQEQVSGELEEALQTYREILTSAELPQELEARVYLRIALCYEKLGQHEKAKSFLENITTRYNNVREVVRLADRHLQENERKKQIAQLREQLYRLQQQPSVDLQAKYEAEIHKLQKHIQELEAKRPNNSKIQQQSDDKEQKIRDSQAFYSEARKLYAKGFLRGAQDHLQQAIELHNGNDEAKKLLKKVQLALSLSESREKTLDAKFGQDWVQINDGEVMQLQYDIRAIPKGREKLWQNNLIALLQSQISTPQISFPASAISFSGENIIVRHQESIQKEAERIFKLLARHPRVLVVRLKLWSGPAQFLHRELSQLKLHFSQVAGGILHARLSPQHLKKLTQSVQKKHIETIHFPEIAVVDRKKTSIEKAFEVPLINGYQQEKFDFTIYREGIRFLCFVDPEQSLITMDVLTRQIKRPIFEIISDSGPIQLPFFLEQNASFSIDIGEEASDIVILGMHNPLYPHNNKYQRDRPGELIALLSCRYFTLEEFLLKPESLYSFPEDKQDNYLETYSIASWQEILDAGFKPSPAEMRDTFLLQLCHRLLTGIDEATILRVEEDQLVVYATPDIHKQVQTLLERLSAQRNYAQQFFCYFASLPNSSLQKFLANYKPVSSDTKALQIHVVNTSRENFWSQLQKLPDMRLSNPLPPAIAYNTQNIELVNYHMHAFWAGTKYIDGFPQAQIEYLPEGAAVQIRPVAISPQNRFLEISSMLYEIKDLNKGLSPLQKGFASSLRPPETFLQRANAWLSYNKGDFYILSGFHDTEDPSRAYIYIVIPRMLNEIKESDDNK